MLVLQVSKKDNRSSGFTLVELLIAVLILSIGLMALAGLQGSAMVSTHKAYMRTQAGIAAMEMAERMRVNVVGVDTNQYINISSPPGAAPTSCETNNCSAAQIAADDAYQWLLSLQNSRDLLSAEGSVTCIDSDGGADADACTDGSLHLITVRWDGRRSGAAGTGCDPTNLADKICHQIRVRP